MGPSARHRVKLEPHAVPDSNWTDPRDTDAGDALVTEHLREQAAKSSKRIAVLKRKQLVRGELFFNWKLRMILPMYLVPTIDFFLQVNQAILEHETRELMDDYDEVRISLRN